MATAHPHGGLRRSGGQNHPKKDPIFDYNYLYYRPVVDRRDP
jgi:hypothetical protein